MIIAANWKAYIESIDKVKELGSLYKKLSSHTEHEIILAPPSPFLALLANKNTSKLSFSSQDVSATLGGAKTGEVTAAAVCAAGAKYAIVGHSERRVIGEDNALISEKLQHALAQGLTPILCVGERERDDNGNYLAFLREEITSALSTLSSKDCAKVIIAYEPIWAIGKTAEESITADDLTEMVLYIRKTLADFISERNSAKAKILYGGSVEAGNVNSLEGCGINGFLIGHASVDVESFSNLVKAITPVK